MHPRHQHHSAYPQAIPKKSRVSAMGLPTLPRTSALKIMATLVAIVLALSFTLSLHAQDTAAGGTGPENALVPNTERTVLDPGETRWYTFLYDEGVDGDNEPSDALAELEMDRPGSIDFEVWTEDDVRMWRNGEDFNPTGAGTAAFDPDSDDNRDRSRLTWVGSGAATTTWYIVVSNESDRAAAFSLSVTGPDVYFPEAGQAAVTPTSTPQTNGGAETATASATMTTTAAMQESTTASQDMTTMAGMGPASALSPTGARRTLAPGESRWYTFRYAEGADADNPSEAVVELAISRPNSIDFEVWTEENVQQWANGEDFTPTGAGTPAFAIEDGDSDNRDRRLLRWVGSGAATTTWYVIVENTSDSAASYRLTVSGP
ncbi:MAG: hypothetical protein KDE31_00005, partial [Caldilineaceae bacterium]|nr:hypothetical protein [Caldilineaceae bacterium]